MKYFLSVSIFVLAAFSLSAQNNQRSLLYNFISMKQQQGVVFNSTEILNRARTEYISDNRIVSNFTGLSLNKQAISDLFNKRPAGIKLNLPINQQQNFELILAAEKINTSGDFSFGTLNGDHKKTKTSNDQGLHYRGYISGDSSSIACISIFKNGEFMGVFANKNGNFVIGRMKNNGDRYILYKSSDMLIQPRYQCATSELTYPASTTANARPKNTIATAPPPPDQCKKVRVYWEVDNHLYFDNFSSDLSETQNYILGLFNVVATIYQNEGIIIELSKTFVWTSPDPYSNGSSNLGLNSFKSYWNGLGDNYDGDLAHLIAGGSTNNGGLAFILNFDQCNRPYTYGYSNVYVSFQSYPNYSWDAQVVTHETGHNLGSNHTHWCGWNTGPGNTCGAIDNCAAFETGAGCDTCFTTTDINHLPAGFKGTIMSYCYLKDGIGVSFVNGFGPLPQAVIRNNVAAAACFTRRNIWTGAVSTAWENTGNWSCGSLPDATTDVVIDKGLTNYPTVNSTTAICRSINESEGASIKVNANYHLTITGKTGN